MSKVSVTKDKLDILANAIANKSGEPLTLTLDEMVSAVDGIENNPAPTLQAKTYTVDSAGTEMITADSGYDGLSSVAVNVPIADPDIGYVSPSFYTSGGQRRWRIQTYCDFPDGEGVGGWVLLYLVHHIIQMLLYFLCRPYMLPYSPGYNVSHKHLQSD